MNFIINKSFGEYLTILIIVLIIIILYRVLLDKKEHMSDFNHFISSSSKWNRNKCDYIMNDTLTDELKNNNIKYSQSNWNLYFPCAYDEIDKEMSQMPVVKGAKYFIIDSIDLMVAKDWLWRCVVAHYGLEKAKILLPPSYTLFDDIDIQRFSKEYDSRKI